MSLYNDASLVLIPSGYKEGKLYSIKPTDGGGDFTFSRASSATRVNSSGLIEKETQNLLLQSNDFSNAIWIYRSGDSSTGGQTGYDGSSNAWLLNVNTGGWAVYQDYVTTGVYTFSLYVKKGTIDIVQIDLFSSSLTHSGQFNLTSGTDVGGGNTIDRTITDVGGGWYRVSISANVSSILYARIGSVAQTGNFYIQDAQLNQGLVADSYLETTTTAVYGGITDNIPRLDYTDASCPSLLLEPQRSNLVTNSEYFGASTWVKQNATITSNYAISPEGVNNASRIVTSGTAFLYQLATFTNAVEYTLSFYVKSNGSGNDDFRLYAEGNSTTKTATNEWIRHEYTFTGQGSSKDFGLRDVGGLTIDILIWGAQLEQESTGMAMPTSYIPTYGTAVTRVSEASAFELSVFDFFSLSNTESGTFFIETKFINQGNAYVDTFSQGGSGTNVWQNTDFVMLDTVSPNSFVVQNITSVIDDYVKILIRKDQTTYNVFINGVKSATTNTITNPLKWFDHIATFRNTQMVKQMIEFPTALTDSECIALTTL